MTIVKHEGSALAIDPQQANFSETQVAALAQIGVDKATTGDLSVFFHVCQRSGLDPFARQIYMIGRESSERGADGEWRKVVKQTIQTGIDGFRLIGRRAADRAKHAVSVSAPEWAHEDGSWRPVWMAAWGTPVAGRVTIHRDGEPFTAVALFDEYKQTKRNGDLTQMWQQRPAGQIAKCAEALAWRLAFPQDLSGIYADVEMDQADARRPDTEEVPSSGAERIRQVLNTTLPDASTAPAAEQEARPPVAPADIEKPVVGITSAQVKKMATGMGEAGLTDRKAALDYVAGVIGRTVTSRNELTKDEASRVIDALERDAANVVEGEIVQEPTPAADLDPDALWREILKVAEGDHDWTPSQVTADFKRAMGLIPDEASAAELAAYLRILVTGEEPAA